MSDADLRANLAAVRERIAEATRRAGRAEGDVLLVAVSKTVPVERIVEAVAAGVTVFGENRVQEARWKIAAVGGRRRVGEPVDPAGRGEQLGASRRESPLQWHLIGHLQTNKVRDALGCFDMIQSVDRLPLAEALSHRAVLAGRRLEILVQVNVGEEPQKGGVRPPDLRPALEAMAELPGLHLRGLMTIPPIPRDPEDSRPHYREMRKLLEAAQGWGLGPDFTELSMGMSGDFEVGIEEGATVVRVGTAIFGPRGG
jgi:pyridoxal phosphate enzyme (YggS family)